MSGPEDEARLAREEAEFRAIVEQFGSRPDFPDLPPPPPPVEDDPAELRYVEDEEHFVPAPPPPVPRPRGLRAVAWFGLFGVPTVVLICLVLSISVPSLVSLLFLVWFVGGFGYLVATMSAKHGDPDSGWDDGAVL